MRIIEKSWVDLYAGYQAVLSLEARLKTDWKRSLRVAQKRSDLAAGTRQNRRRKITIISLLVFVFLCILFCAGYYVLPESRLQLFIYFCMLGIPAALLWLVYLINFGGIAGTRHENPPTLEIEEAWWNSLRPKRYAIQKDGDQGEIDFLKSLSFLDNNYIAIWGLLTSVKRRSDTDVLVLGPSGIWIFEVKYWNGTISRTNGVWARRNMYGQTKRYEKGPDEQWLDQKEEVSKTIRMHLSTKVWPDALIRGGIVFAHRKSRLGEIQQSAASYGHPVFGTNSSRRRRPSRISTCRTGCECWMRSSGMPIVMRRKPYKFLLAAMQQMRFIRILKMFSKNMSWRR
jgi:hypothetical protein